MKLNLFNTLLILIVFTSCTNYVGDTHEISVCLTEKIMEFDNEAPCPDVSVSQYIFQGKVVYTFDPGTCGADMSSNVLNEDCVSIGYLGGFPGNTTVNGEDFSKAVFVKIIWKKSN